VSFAGRREKAAFRPPKVLNEAQNALPKAVWRLDAGADIQPAAGNDPI
jgi:hypothetical protein